MNSRLPQPHGTDFNIQSDQTSIESLAATKDRLSTFAKEHPNYV
jgi:hypothetical protein